MASKSTYTTPRGEKRYLVRWLDRSTGKHRGKTFARSKDADVFKTDIERKAQLGLLYREGERTFGEYAGLALQDGRVVITGDGWFERYAATVRESTLTSRQAVMQHLKPLLGARLDRLTVTGVSDVVYGVAAEHPRTGVMLLGLVRRVIRDAQAEGVPVETRVLAIPAPLYEKAERRFLSREEVERLAEASTEPNLIRFAAYTGLRRGELIALTDADVDDAKVQVRRSLYRRQESRPKSERSTRVVPLPQAAKDALTAQQAQRTHVRYIFAQPDGRPWSGTMLSKLVGEWAVKAKLPGATLHGLRHTYASWLIEAGAHPKVIQELMGHSSIKTTMDEYGHLFEGHKAEAVAALDRALQ